MILTNKPKFMVYLLNVWCQIQQTRSQYSPNFIDWVQDTCTEHVEHMLTCAKKFGCNPEDWYVPSRCVITCSLRHVCINVDSITPCSHEIIGDAFAILALEFTDEEKVLILL